MLDFRAHTVDLKIKDTSCYTISMLETKQTIVV
jgi:hypothetical protein